MKLYALFTLHETGWGTRTGIGDRTLSFPITSHMIPLTFTSAATATAATEKRGGVDGPGPMHGAAQGGVYDVEMNGMKRKG